MMLPTCQWDNDPPLAVFFFFCNDIIRRIWPQHCIIQNISSPLYKWFDNTSFRTISWMLQLPETHWRRGTLIIIIITIIIIKAIWPLLLDFEPKPLVSECILVGLGQCNSDSFNTVRYTNTAMKPCLPLKCLVYPKRSFHASSFVLLLFVLDVRGRGTDFDSFKFGEKKKLGCV